MKIKIKPSNIIWYLAIFPFLFPLGFVEFSSTYKKFSILVIGIATVIIFLREVYLIIASQGKIKISKPLLAVLVYHVTLLVITICVQGTITQGIQKIFVTPAICILLDEGCQKDGENIIDVICNLLILDFVLNLFVFNQWIVPKYFLINKHIMFIGHVQIAAEIGILGFLIAYIEYKSDRHKKKSIFLAVLSMLTMLYSQTTASFLGLCVLIFFWIFRNVVSVRRFINKHEYLVAIIILVVSTLLINIRRMPLTVKYNAILTTLFNGRTYIWDTGLNLFVAKPLFGYGAYGVLIKVFWSTWSANKLGFNYAHSTILQLLLDGGIVLAAIFIVVVALYIKSEDDKLSDGNIKYMAHVLLIAFLSVGMVESLTEYYYIFMFLSVLPYLYKLDNTDSNIINNIK